MNKSKQKKRLPTPKQKIFIDEYTKTGNATEAASKAYKCNNRMTAASIGKENLWKPYIEADINKRLADAKNMIYTIAMTSEKDDTKLRACQDIADRVEGKPVQRVISENVIKVIDENTPMEELLSIIKK